MVALKPSFFLVSEQPLALKFYLMCTRLSCFFSVIVLFIVCRRSHGNVAFIRSTTLNANKYSTLRKHI